MYSNQHTLFLETTMNDEANQYIPSGDRMK
jgi:hypothetical protein